MKLSNTQQILLAEISRRTHAIRSAQEPPTWERWAHADWKDQTTFGARYSCSRWFGKVAPSERMRFYRALRALEQSELIEVTRVEALRSRQQVFLRLTEAGATLAGELLNAK